MKRIILLGATGSIGKSVCDVVRMHPQEFRIVALAVRHSLAAAESLGREFGAKVYSGEEGAAHAVEENEADVVVVATVGLSGLRPTLSAIAKGIESYSYAENDQKSKGYSYAESNQKSKGNCNSESDQKAKGNSNSKSNQKAKGNSNTEGYQTQQKQAVSKCR